MIQHGQPSQVSQKNGREEHRQGDPKEQIMAAIALHQL